jgi:hypothetical protein
MANNNRNVFISHIHEDDPGLADLKNLVQQCGLNVSDYSITSDKPNAAKDPDYIKREILAPRIDQASVLIVYVSPGTKESYYVNWEIEYAAKLGKRIVGVWERGANECEVPDALEKYADAMVGWHGESIVDAIKGGSNDWFGCDGAAREYRPIKRYDC